MRWRLLKLDWNYAIGELIIVTVGVLIALAIDQWNTGRLERVEEVLIIERLISDLEVDLGNFEQGLSNLLRKEGSLERVYAVLTSADSEPQDLAGFLGDVIYGAQYGWNQSTARRITIDELLGSGKFGLIRNTDLRESISDYYTLDQGANRRIEERETQYPNISYELVPRASEFGLDPSLTEPQLEQLAAGVFDSTLIDYVIAEINFSRFTRDQFTDLQAGRDGLESELEIYLDAIQ